MYWRCAVLLVLAASFQMRAEDSTTSRYVFPIFEAGAAGGITYKSALRILNANTTNPVLNCTLTQRGSAILFSGIQGNQYYPEIFDAGDNPPAVTLIRLDRYTPWEILRSTNKSAFQGGYAVLTCPGTVDTELQVSLADTAGIKIGETSISPAIQASSFEFLLDSRDGSRLGVALVNDSQIEGEYTIIARDEYRQEIYRAYDTLGPWSRVSRFVDEALKLPPNFCGSIEVIGVRGGRNYAVGLQHTGTVLSTVAPLTRSSPLSF
jgi:hypothetical protein